VGETGWRVIAVRPTPLVPRHLATDLDQLRILGALVPVLLVTMAAAALFIRRRRPG
jgi:hypothetical protein